MSTPISSHERMHHAALGLKVLPFLSQEEKNLCAQANKAWMQVRMCRSPAKQIKNLMARALRISSNQHYVDSTGAYSDESLFRLYRDDTKEPHPLFASKVTDLLCKIASIPIGVKLIASLTVAKHPIVIVSANKSCSVFLKNKHIIAFSVSSAIPQEGRKVIFQRKDGKMYMGYQSDIAALAHELIHVYRADGNKTLKFNFQKDPFFCNGEEMITTMGYAKIGDCILKDPISENAICSQLRFDARVSHYVYNNHLDIVAKLGIDGEMQKWIQCGISQNERERLLRLAIQGVCTKHSVRGNHLSIIALLMRTGCKKKLAFDSLLEVGRELVVTPEQVVGIAKKISAYPLHDALKCKWKKREIKWLLNAFLEAEGADSLISLLHVKNKQGLTPLQIAQKIVEKHQQLWAISPMTQNELAKLPPLLGLLRAPFTTQIEIDACRKNHLVPFERNAAYLVELKSLAKSVL